MERNNRWMVIFLVVLAALVVSACKPKSTTMTNEPAAVVEEIPGSELKRVVLTEKAAERLGIQTVTVREEQIVRKQILGGEVVAQGGAATASPGKLWVRVPLNGTDMKMVARDQPALVMPLGDDDEEDSDDDENGLLANLEEALGLDEDEDEDTRDSALYYTIDSTRVALGQRVLVQLSLSSSGIAGKIIPYAALIYDVNGRTWVYTKEPNALAFVRHEVTVDFITDEVVVLMEGPPAGTEIVTMGGQELYGAETGVSK